ncbi:MAG: type II secretion system F family protein [Candidatus Marsarchaeota archaeon]|jgi:pilus assembly protein TadC|nr:type II secretion system F family protein [Candidatus Marsarchaeota archaeon]
MFGKKQRIVNVGGQPIALEPKPRKGILGLFGKGKHRQPAAPAPAAPIQTPQQAPAQQPQPKSQTWYDSTKMQVQSPSQTSTPVNVPTPSQVLAPKSASHGLFGRAKPGAARQVRQGRWHTYIESIGSKQTGLEMVLKEQHINESLYSFVQRMVFTSMILAAVIAITVFALFLHIGIREIAAAILGIMLGVAIFYGFLRSFLNFPKRRAVTSAKLIERDILFSARDLIIALRSGMPLFNALISVSTGYGESSKEFSRIVERVQVGMPLEQAIDEALAETKSPSFRRIMLQASVSIKAGADVVAALQSVIDQLSQERVIELRRYGQRLNAIAMFYMLFGIILPSMGVAVLTILTTFIALFTVTPTLLEGALVGIAFLQIVFLQLIRTSRPTFTM